MPQNKTLLGGSAAGGVALLQPHVQEVMHDLVITYLASFLPTPQAQDSLSTLLSVAAMSALGVLLVARDRVVDHIQHGGIPQVRLRGPLSRLLSWFAPAVEPRPRVTPDDEEPNQDEPNQDEIVAPLPREEQSK